MSGKDTVDGQPSSVARASALVGKRIMWRVKGTIPYAYGFVTGARCGIVSVGDSVLDPKEKNYALEDIDYRVIPE